MDSTLFLKLQCNGYLQDRDHARAERHALRNGASHPQAQARYQARASIADIARRRLRRRAGSALRSLFGPALTAAAAEEAAQLSGRGGSPAHASAIDLETARSVMRCQG